MAHTCSFCGVPTKVILAPTVMGDVEILGSKGDFKTNQHYRHLNTPHYKVLAHRFRRSARRFRESYRCPM